MRLLILSDLHLEVWRHDAPPILPRQSRPDVVVLAGDIGPPAEVLHWAGRHFAGLPVLFVPGNHEAYGNSWEGAMRELARQARDLPDVHLLDRAELVIGQVRFLGATLWTDYALFGPSMTALAMAAALPVMADYRRITVEHGGVHDMRPEDTVSLHQRDLAWLRERLHAPFPGRTVVVTHMAPSMHSVAPRYADDPVSAAFASRLDELATLADLWVHGHTHDSFDYRLQGCRVVCNPCGYMRRDGSPENARFDPQFIVEI
ncbi:metallophosphoesterase [Herbaspirillum sp. YR522]|uniref:metallophosphoesterase n=1 Tax=Herbaspirillum sp. YR522 TaxID=1144342 RepID=UPI00026FCDC3|nr:metallophosphoesterase [Herbaspirillum sp. YR522]EJM97570.1 DNA repair exonuclease [Herbaspirillum sp. YR522]